ncbi:hypothetical protein GQX74_012316 [Glossina fuscipes]|nr:hypothetical protein GQX74_012316 [Glossina fuscipes]
MQNEIDKHDDPEEVQIPPLYYKACQLYIILYYIVGLVEKKKKEQRLAAAVEAAAAAAATLAAAPLIEPRRDKEGSRLGGTMGLLGGIGGGSPLAPAGGTPGTVTGIVTGGTAMGIG